MTGLMVRGGMLTSEHNLGAFTSPGLDEIIYLLAILFGAEFEGRRKSRTSVRDNPGAGRLETERLQNAGIYIRSHRDLGRLGTKSTEKKRGGRVSMKQGRRKKNKKERKNLPKKEKKVECVSCFSTLHKVCSIPQRMNVEVNECE